MKTTTFGVWAVAIAATMAVAACGGAAPAAPSVAAPTQAAAQPSAAKPAASVAASAAAKPAASVASSGAAKPAASGAASGAAKPAATTKINVAISSLSATNLPTWIANDGGIFAQHGLETDIRVIAGGSTTTSALLGGDVQVVMGGGSEALAAAAGGADLVILGISVPKYTQLLEVPASVKTPADLKGKTLGVPAARGTVDIATRSALKGMGLQADTDVKIASLGSVQAVTAAVLSGAVDGAAMNVPDNLAAESKGFHPLINMATDPKAPAAASNTIYSQRSYINAHKDIIQNYVDSEILAVARLKKDKPLAETVVRKYLKLDDQKALDATYDFFSNGVFPDLPFPRPELFDEVKQQVGQANPAVLTFDLNKILDPSFVQSAADRGLNKG